MDRFDTMLAFTRVVELKSFTKAAVSLNIPKATLSAQVAALEKRLNVKLLHRTTRHVSTTSEGAGYYAHARVLLTQLNAIETSVSQASQSYKGRLRVDTSGTLGRNVILPAINDFFQQYPDIDLELGCTDRTVDLLQEGIDCAIRSGMPMDESLVARKLIETNPVTCASPAYLDKKGKPNNLEALKAHDVINFISPRTGKLMGFEYLLPEKSQTIFGCRKIAMNDFDACVKAAVTGIGIAQLPYFSVREHLKSGRLIPLLTEYPTTPLPVYVVYLPNRHLTSNVRAFIDWVVELFNREKQLLM